MPRIIAFDLEGIILEGDSLTMLQIQHKSIYYFSNSGTIGLRGYVATYTKDYLFHIFICI